VVRNLSQKISNKIKQAVMKRRMPLFAKLVSEDKAWALYIHVIEKYITKAKAKKAAVKLVKITPEGLKDLERLETEIETLEWVIRIPQATIDRTLVKEKEEEETKLAEEIKEEQKNE